MSYDYLFKVIVVGESGVGKSNLMMRYMDDKFNNNYELTIGVEFGTKIIKFNNNQTVKLNIWDTAGQESFRSIVRSYYKEATVALLVYDVTNIKSFNSLQKWLDDITGMSHNPCMMLVGNKIDLTNANTNANKREVTVEQGEIFASEHGMGFIETSALNGTGVNDAFYIPVSSIFKKIMSGEIDAANPSHGIKKIGKTTHPDNTIDLNRSDGNKRTKPRCCLK
jgi:Ras-related protein Rab-2A